AATICAVGSMSDANFLAPGPRRYFPRADPPASRVIGEGRRETQGMRAAPLLFWWVRQSASRPRCPVETRRKVEGTAAPWPPACVNRRLAGFHEFITLASTSR